MGYEAYLRQLLEPLGVYTFRPGSVSGAETASVGAALDAAAAALETAEREGIVPTAEDTGLARMESLFARRPAAPTLETRREAVAALLRINGDGFTREAINRTLSGCGVTAHVAETDTKGLVRVTFPNTAGIPPEFDQISRIILDIIPCHLETEFYFRYLTWTELEARFADWAAVEAAEHTWQSLELAV